MKKLLQKTVVKYKLYGLYNIIENVFYKTRNVFFRLRYKNNNRFDLAYKGLNIAYSTTDAYSKQWFYPDFLDNNYYEPAVMEMLLTHLKADSCFIDVGANLGYFTCFAAAICTEGQVHAFEMDINCQTLIDKNIAINQFQHVKNNQNIITNKEAVMDIAKYDYPQPKLSIFNENATQRQKVKAITMDKYIEENDLKPTLIKIDVEGAEYNVLQGMEQTLQQSQVKLLVEIHANVLKVFGFDYNEILDLLWKNGFQLSQVMEHRKIAETSSKLLQKGDVLVGNTLIFATKE